MKWYYCSRHKCNSDFLIISVPAIKSPILRLSVRKPAREPHLHGVLAACLRSFSRTLTADSRIKSIDRGNIIWYHIHALAVTEDSATVRTDTSAVNGVGGKSDAMR